MSTTTVTVRRRMRSTAQALFDLMSTPERFAEVRGIRGVDVVRAGEGGVASVGTIRRVNLAAGFLVEEIVGLEAPSRFDYRIREASIPFEHRFGRIEFLDRGDHTEAVWTSTFAFGVPLAGAAIAAGAGLVTRVAFGAALREIDRAARG